MKQVDLKALKTLEKRICESIPEKLVATDFCLT
jgi:hypothetical protein